MSPNFSARPMTFLVAILFAFAAGTMIDSPDAAPRPNPNTGVTSQSDLPGIVGDWEGERFLPNVRGFFVRQRDVFIRFSSYGTYIMKIDGSLGLREYAGEYRVSGRTIVLAGDLTTSTLSRAVWFHDVVVGDETLNFIMQPAPTPFGQDLETAVCSMRRL